MRSEQNRFTYTQNLAQEQRGTSELWVKRFYGVSTKYLSQYLNWFVFLEKVKKSSTQTLDLAKNVAANAKAINTYRSIEDRYSDLGIPQLSKT